VEIAQLAIPDAYLITPRQFNDDRGTFLEWYRFERLEAVVGHPLRLAQANCSISRTGTLRGVHYAEVPPSQAKYVFCARGMVVDVVVDLRVGSPAFGSWEAVTLDDQTRCAVYLSEGLGHAFMALTDDATVVYLCTEVYNPTGEHGVNPLDPELGIAWPDAVEPLLSPKDAAAPTLDQALQIGALPHYERCRQLYDSLRTAPVTS
jgi:dTDP-4-dehydrorhamnose 3,5-epimerase